jgi:S-adenosylhomocysteine hydrolase
LKFHHIYGCRSSLLDGNIIATYVTCWNETMVCGYRLGMSSFIEELLSRAVVTEVDTIFALLT